MRFVQQNNAHLWYPLSALTELLAVLIFAEQTNHTFFEHAGPVEGTLTRLPDHFELKKSKLPDEPSWGVAVQRAASVLGVAISPLLKAANVAALTGQAKSKAAERTRIRSLDLRAPSGELTHEHMRIQGEPKACTQGSVHTSGAS